MDGDLPAWSWLVPPALRRVLHSDESAPHEHGAAANARSATIRLLAGKLDLDIVGRQFGKYSGSDNLLDRSEFDRFTQSSNLSRQQAESMWLALDKNGDGIISRAEFDDAVQNMLAARAWLRYCPECIYANTCVFCQECNASCHDCNETAFCSLHWADHPARTRQALDVDDAEGASRAAAKMSVAGLARHHLVIRPLTWVYQHPGMAWLPVGQKAALRRVLRSQQQLNEDEQTRGAAREIVMGGER